MTSAKAPSPPARIFTLATVPPELVQAWLQHLRNFDRAHEGCHFKVAVDAPPDMTMLQMIDALRIDPELSFMKLFRRRRKGEK